MAERIPDCPRATDQLTYVLLATEALETTSMIGGQAVVVPANRATDLIVIGVDPPGRMVRGRDSTGGPIVQSADLTQSLCHRPCACPRLPFELHQIELGNAALDPKISWKTDLG